MSGALAGFTDSDNWHGSGLLKNLVGLPIAGALGSPQWIKKYPQSAMAAAAIAATVLSAGAAAPAAGAAMGGGAAAEGAGAAAIGAGATDASLGAAGAANAAAIGAGATDASLGAAGAANMGLLGTPYAAEIGAGATDASLGAAGLLNVADAAAGATDASLGAAGTQNASLLGQFQHAMNSPTAKSALKSYQTYQRTQSAIDALSPKPQQAAASIARPPMNNTPIVGGLDQPPSTPYSPYDPLWVAYLHRHPQQGASYG